MIWSDLYPDVMPSLPGCPEPTLEDAMRRAATEFCRETHLWQEELQPIFLANGINRYQLEVPDGTELLSLVSALQRKSPSEEGTKLWPTINIFGRLHFDPLPDPNNGPVEIRAILQPSRTATGVPDRVGLEYDAALIHGTIAKLQAVPGKDWSNPGMVAYHHQLFLNAITDARIRRTRQNSEAPLRVKPFPTL